MKNLTLIGLNEADYLVHPEEFNEITLNSPAITIFTDFKEYKPLEIEADISAVQAEFLMRKAHVRLKLVVNRQGELVGTISLEQLSEQNIQIHRQKGLDREDILVRHLMTPRVEIKALEYKHIISSTVEDVIDTLKKNGTQHCLVVDSNEHQIRGIISTSDIARRLHIPLDVDKKTTTFVDVFNAIHD